MKPKYNFEKSWKEQQEYNLMTPLERWVDDMNQQLIGACAMGAIILIALYFF